MYEDKTPLSVDCLAYLDSLPVVLWRDWDIKNSESRELAAAWLAATIREVLAIRQQRKEQQ